MQRGEIYLASFPFGNAQGMKLRPVLLLDLLHQSGTRTYPTQKQPSYGRNSLSLSSAKHGTAERPQQHRYLHRMGSVLASGFFLGIGAEPARFRSECGRVGAKGGRKCPIAKAFLAISPRQTLLKHSRR